MNRRTKFLGIGFALIVAYALYDQVVHPVWIKPMLTLDETIAQRQEVLEGLEAKEAQVELKTRQYPSYAARVGSMDAGHVENDLRARLNKLIDGHGLRRAKVGKGRLRTDRKSGLQRMTIAVDGECALESAVEFLRDLAELPDLVQVAGVDLSPSSASRRSKKKDQVNLGVTLTALVLPQQQLVGRLTEADLQQQEALMRHAGLDYSLIWQADPFSEYEKPTLRPTSRQTAEQDSQSEEERPRRTVDRRWKDRSQWQLCMALLGGDGTSVLDEFMMVKARGNGRRYTAVGDDFDGGTLLYVHQRGALVGREDGEFVYPLGMKLDEPIPLAEATNFPELQAAARRLEAAREATTPREDAKEGPETVGGAQSRPRAEKQPTEGDQDEAGADSKPEKLAPAKPKGRPKTDENAAGEVGGEPETGKPATVKPQGDAETEKEPIT